MKAIKKWIILVEESRKGQIVCDSEEEAKKLFDDLLNREKDNDRTYNRIVYFTEETLRSFGPRIHRTFIEETNG
tara:strand:+ start:1250 stop:1471 length:222 start_codon:yes stop_codon:yes gene_type:complete